MPYGCQPGVIIFVMAGPQTMYFRFITVVSQPLYLMMSYRKEESYRIMGSTEAQKSALRQGWYDFALASPPQRLPAKQTAQARSYPHPPDRHSFLPREHGGVFKTSYPGAGRRPRFLKKRRPDKVSHITPPPLLSFFFSRRASVISTYIPFSLTHAGPCAIEFPGAQVSRPARPSFF